MRAIGWLTTTSGQVTAGVVGILMTSALVGAGVVSLTGSSSSGGGTAAAKPQPTPTPTSCNNGSGGGNGFGNCSPGSDNKTFLVTGTVAQLVPGASRTLALSIHNNASQAINIRTLAVQAADVKNSVGVVVCAASNLLLGSGATAGSGSIAPAALQIAGNASVSNVAFPIRLAASAGNGCKDVTWQLTYSGTADQA